ncbi:SAM-dependent chlorinase/fluorinase [Paracrocinitomix mangrovi]|uniref:SAM hydrolase/SAM-dependent halogenase family protein n=1 Tax=Paracrocinitomix mangrovi TaxID=2862509 RepID=UPI001C8D0A4A|nr:SAM-dependent chlorinase/fluorinase [Paracrocinitomix mangrovi]UKN02899.1 SAM-dependent chlorinase/fluorinase [Paracrocinitomix mangrovi]
MKIITLTTDLGLRDHYVAAIKGQLYSKIKDSRVVDISHEVQPFNLAEAAYYINNITEDFPEGTVHFIGVDHLPVVSIAASDNNLYPIVMKLKGQYFVGCDNGMFSLINGFEEAEEIIRIDNFSAKSSLRFPTRNIYLPAIVAICEGKPLSDIGETMKSVRKAFTTQPTIEQDLIKGTVIHEDKYGNVMVNITEKLFKEVGMGNPFTIFFRNSKYFIEKISSNYYDVPMGEKLALFNENGYLEIAINKGVQGSGGGASSLLGLHVKDTIRIEFHPKGSKNRIEELLQNQS